MKKLTIKQIVEKNLENLKTKSTAQELYQAAVELGFDNKSAFPRFKAALLENGIDFDAIKTAGREQAAAKLEASVTHEVILYSDAKARTSRFAICDKDGKVAWYGRFFEDDRDGFNGEQSSGELSAAMKAIWFARQIANSVKAGAIRLILNVDANWLCTLSGQAAALAESARRHNIQLVMQWIQGTNNPADEFTTASGYMKWNERDLTAMVGEPAPKVEAPVIVVPETAPVTEAAVETKSPVIDPARGSVERDAWFAAHKTEWPVMREAWKQEGLSSKQRDERLAGLIVDWAAKNLQAH